MTSYKPGDVVEVPFPFIDLPVRKWRPALVLSSEVMQREQGVVILAMITSAKRNKWNSDVSLQEWQQAGLKAPSIVRWKIFTFESALIQSRRGSLTSEDKSRVSTSFQKVVGAFLLKNMG
jgi:mRNA interferase MazF